MDQVEIILLTLSINLVYGLIHYLVRKISQIYALKYASKNQENSNLKTFLSNSSDKDQINEIHIWFSKKGFKKNIIE